jgi:uncharacterized protein (DUF433 family)
MVLNTRSDPLPLEVDTDGVARIGGTRVTLDTVVAAFAEGATAEEIVQQYPSLALADVYVVLGFYLRHRSEVDVYLRQREQQAQRIRSLVESRSDVEGLRQRLLARQSSPHQ